MCLFLFASKIHDESRGPLKVLRSIPSMGWYTEVQKTTTLLLLVQLKNNNLIYFQTERFCQQIHNEKVALTGRKFFYLTRTLLISIFSCVVTYELVLLQFDGNKGKPAMFNPCPKTFNFGG